MFKSIVVVALFAIVTVQGGIIASPAIVQPVVTSVIHNVPSAVSYQSFTKLVNNVAVPAIKAIEVAPVEPVVKAAEVEAAAPVEEVVSAEADVKSVEAAPAVASDSVEVVAAPEKVVEAAPVAPVSPVASVVKGLPYAPLVQTYAASPFIGYQLASAAPVVAYHSAPTIVKSISAPLIYTVQH